MKGCCNCLTLLLILASFATAQVPVAHDGELALGFAHNRSGETATWFVDYLEHGGEPAFRIAVHHFHAECDGYLYIGKTKIAYVPAFTPEQYDGFEVARSNLKSASPRYSGFSFTFGDRTQQFAFLSEPAKQAVSSPDSREQLMLFVHLMMTDFGLAQSEFGLIAAGWQQSFSPTAATKDATGAPGIRVLAPAGVADGAWVDAGSESLALVGIVAQPTPVRGLLMNGQPLPTRPITKNIVEFQSAPRRLEDAATPVNLSTNSDSGQSQITFTVRKPTISFASMTLYTADATATVKGTIAGYGEVERIELEGKAASVTRTPNNSFWFITPNLPVNPGKNVLQGTIIGVDGSTHSFSVVVERRVRLSLDFVRRAIRTLSRARLLEILDAYGVDFQLDEETTKQLRAAGADEKLLDAIADAGPP